GADPQGVVRVLVDGADTVAAGCLAATRGLHVDQVAEAGTGGVGDRHAAGQPAEPQHPAAVDHQAADGVLGQACRDDRAADPATLGGIGVEPDQPGAVGGQPQAAVGRLRNRPHAAVVLVAGGRPPSVGERVADHPEQTVLAADPQGAVAVQQQAARGNGTTDATR